MKSHLCLPRAAVIGVAHQAQLTLAFLSYNIVYVWCCLSSHLAFHGTVHILCYSFPYLEFEIICIHPSNIKYYLDRKYYYRRVMAQME